MSVDAEYSFVWSYWIFLHIDAASWAIHPASIVIVETSADDRGSFSVAAGSSFIRMCSYINILRPLNYALYASNEVMHASIEI